MSALTYKERAMMDEHTIATQAIYAPDAMYQDVLNESKKELQIYWELVLLRRDDAANKSASDKLGRRLQLAACIVATSRLSNEQLEWLVRNITGTLPSPINLANTNEGL
jgi:hypothetical protein